MDGIQGLGSFRSQFVETLHLKTGKCISNTIGGAINVCNYDMDVVSCSTKKEHTNQGHDLWMVCSALLPNINNRLVVTMH